MRSIGTDVPAAIPVLHRHDHGQLLFLSALVLALYLSWLLHSVLYDEARVSLQTGAMGTRLE